MGGEAIRMLCAAKRALLTAATGFATGCLAGLVASCGGAVPALADAGGDTPDASGSPTSGGGVGPGPACDTPGERRPAAPSEMAQYCICSPMGEDLLIWECYGPPPSAPTPQATCNYTTVQPGTGNGSCVVSWEHCSDGQVYSLSCIDSVCYCLVQGQVTVNLEPLQSCPESEADLNSLCGWNLQ